MCCAQKHDSVGVYTCAYVQSTTRKDCGFRCMCPGNVHSCMPTLSAPALRLIQTNTQLMQLLTNL